MYVLVQVKTSKSVDIWKKKIIKTRNIPNLFVNDFLILLHIFNKHVIMYWRNNAVYLGEKRTSRRSLSFILIIMLRSGETYNCSS